MTVFGQTYASEYDELYKDKDYTAECDLIEEAFHRFANGSVRKVVDLGCGTGGHAIVLGQRGYQVSGVDLSSTMLAVARQKSVQAGISAEWVQGDIRSATASGPFDAGLFMFAVLGYLVPNDDVVTALENARRQLRAGAVLVFDVWYGPAVLTMKPADRAKVVPIPGGNVIRLTTASLDTRHHTCQVRYHLWRLVGNHLEAESEESHVVRYFFPMELELMLAQSRFALASLTAFPTLDRDADETTWNVVGVALAV